MLVEQRRASNPAKQLTLGWPYRAGVDIDVVLSVLLDGLLFCQAYRPDWRVRENHRLQSQAWGMAWGATFVSARAVTALNEAHCVSLLG